jgi:hypothetical protein
MIPGNGSGDRRRLVAAAEECQRALVQMRKAAVQVNPAPVARSVESDGCGALTRQLVVAEA